MDSIKSGVTLAGAVIFASLSLLICSEALGVPQARSPAEVLISELGCVGCHLGLPDSTDIRDVSPDLSDAGLRFNPAYLFAYLQNPTKVRPYIWPTRMPDFKFSPEEALALTLYLETQRQEKLKDA
ncbi:hypothetical protein MJD09_01160, partial [bacterium]|nr:hypothetical protein [bacterium]